MLKHRWTDRICCVVLALTLLITAAYMGAAGKGLIVKAERTGYEKRLFDTSRVHSIDIVMDDWEGFLKNCTSEEYASCTAVIDGEKYSKIAIRAKGNTSLSSVAAYGNNRYSFKIEFDHYVSGKSYYGLDKLCLNNIIQDNTYVKDYLAYTLMNKMGVATPLCSYAWITVNGNDWGLYLAVEAVEDAFLTRNYSDQGELYKPDSMSFGGGRGNGRDFNMDEFREKFQQEQENAAQTQETTDAQVSAPQKAPASGTQDAASNGGMPSGNPFGASQGGPQGGTSGDSSFSPSQGGPQGGSSGDSSFNPSQGGPQGGTSGESSFTPPQGGPQGGMPENMSGSPFQGGFGGFGMGNADVQLQYIDDDPESYPNIFGNAKTDVSEEDQARLIASLKALSEGDASVVDQDVVLRYMAVHNFLVNDDSYTGMMVHNYYLHEVDGILSMIPWDYNLSMGGMGMNGGDATSTVNTPINTLVSSGNDSSRPMAGWITADAEALERYDAVYQEFADKAVAEGWFTTELDAIFDMIAPYVAKDPTAFCTYEDFEKGAEALRTFCTLRLQSVIGQLSGEIPATTNAQRSDSTARVDASTLDLSVMGSMNGMGGGPGFNKDDMPGDMPDPSQMPNFDPQNGAPAFNGQMPNFDPQNGAPTQNGQMPNLGSQDGVPTFNGQMPNLGSQNGAPTQNGQMPNLGSQDGVPTFNGQMPNFDPQNGVPTENGQTPVFGGVSGAPQEEQKDQ